MPLTTTVSWPSLVEGKKAKASDVESKFEWIEGDQWPMVGGVPTTGVYDIGTSSHRWAVGYFDSVRSENLYSIATQTSEEINANIKAYSFNIQASGTTTTEVTYNISSVSVLTTGVYRISFTNPFATSTYAAIATAVNDFSGGVYATTYNHTVSSVDVYTFTYSGTRTATRFDFLATGAQ